MPRIVIDIDEEEYRAISINKGVPYHLSPSIGNAILNGKPLDGVLGALKEEILQLDYNLDYIDYDYDDMVQTAEVHMICREEVLLVIDEHKKSEGTDGN